ncbi:unnamed protein product [Mytilus coruscus]|uniref:EGF-like domain-containing protein n=1 Tax=Mytilus coruscus TaxID=42192 RepID=A0A6J8EXJ2_MYTCO|nr:unnamed protein product [Mytilus coruscus]
MMIPGEILDNDCDGLIDEELPDGKDNDGDGKLDEDLAMFHIDVDECVSDPCMHAGTCIDVINFYNCSCIDGYTGNNWQTKINECKSNPCQNNGTCVEIVGGYHCVCTNDSSGGHCERNRSLTRKNKIKPEKDLPKSQKEEINVPPCSDDKSKEKIKSPSDSRRKVPVHSSETHNCFVDHTGFDFSKFYVNKDGSRTIPKMQTTKTY